DVEPLDDLDLHHLLELPDQQQLHQQLRLEHIVSDQLVHIEQLDHVDHVDLLDDQHHDVDDLDYQLVHVEHLDDLDNHQLLELLEIGRAARRETDQIRHIEQLDHDELPDSEHHHLA